MLDIKEGDILVVGALEYRIRFVGEYAGWPASPTFRRLASIAASTKRAGAIVSGKRTDPVVCLAALYCTPIDPASSDLSQSIVTKSPLELKESFAGDATGFVRLALEELKT